MRTIAGKEIDRLLCRDSQRPFNVPVVAVWVVPSLKLLPPPQKPVVAAPPQAVTKTPASRWFSPNVQHRRGPPTRMTSNRARHELVRLPAISVKVQPGGCSARAYNRGPSRGRSPIQVCPGTGTLPRPRPRFVRNRGRSGPVTDSHRGVRALL